MKTYDQLPTSDICCGNCPHQSLSEEEQAHNISCGCTGPTIEHYCVFYQQTLHHIWAEPEIPRLIACLLDQTKESE